ncbi:DNA-binding protein Fis [Oceanisphaera litoralis]|uniref:hypothetical protein n=1 Tax=Oceanisphaera litoralis TaxID=225144 RepID=UPI00195B6C58|nr:hypothetical protein [Oceanisphaera litoralis]MBM7455197.1 DNA-binding protein Fis [Oceanisphaera litoralis]
MSTQTLNALVKQWLEHNKYEPELYAALIEQVDTAVMQHFIGGKGMNQMQAAAELGINRKTVADKARRAGYRFTRREQA